MKISVDFSPETLARLAGAVGSTSAILKASPELDASEFIVANDSGMMHKLRALKAGQPAGALAPDIGAV